MVIRVYWASVTGNRKVNGDQSRLRNLIETLKIESKWIDITQSRSVMDQMRAECSNPKALPPQIFNDEVYLGTVDDMNQSIEDGRLNEWLKEDLVVKEPWQDVAQNESVQIQEKEEQPCVGTTDSPTAQEIIKPTRGSVSSAINSFENPDTSPKISRKTVDLQFNKPAESNANHASKVDDERRRRILGLPPLEGDVGNGAGDVVHEQEANGVQEMSVSKMKSIYEVKNAA